MFGVCAPGFATARDRRYAVGIGVFSQKARHLLRSELR